MTPEALLFDLDGVLVESDEVWFRVLNGVAEELGYPAISREEFLAANGQGIEADIECWYPAHSVETIEGLYAQHFPRNLEHGAPMQGVPELFAELRERAIPTAVVTNTPNPIATWVVRHVGATPDHVVGGTDVPRSKPSPDIVLEACRRLSVTAGAAWLLGDSSYDKEAAEAAGARFVGFRMDGDARIEQLMDLLDLL